MKQLQKYANIALFLISATAMIPAYANSNVNAQEKIKQEEVIVKFPKTSMRRIWQYAKENPILAATMICLIPTERLLNCLEAVLILHLISVACNDNN